MKLLYSTFLALLSLLFISCQKGEKQQDELTLKLKERSESSRENAPAEILELYEGSIERLRELGLPDQALKKGDKAPSFSFETQGQSYAIKEIFKEKYVVLTFYRGGWCPYCMIQLGEYQKHYESFQKLGAELIALAPDVPREIERTRNRFDLSFPMVSDKNHAIAREFGLVFQVEPEIVESYSKTGINLADFQGNNKNELPLAATYVIDRSGTIVFSFVEADYKLRATPSDIKEVLRSLQ